MNTRLHVALGAAAILASPCLGQTTHYRLSANSTYEVGCHDPCDCLLRQDSMGGTFSLSLIDIGPLFRTYAVGNVQWSTMGVDIRGSGSYRIGGEVANQQQMALDLTVNGTTSHFDSGLVTTAAQFPAIAVFVDNQVGAQCFYSAAFIDAAPVGRCSADFDGDGSVGTDGDIEAFFSCLAGNCCVTCGDADFNGDGDIGTDADIESFFRVLAGGAC
jgi:hypothetical protein